MTAPICTRAVEITSRCLLLAAVIAIACLGLTSAAAIAKPFPVDQFSYYLNDYDQELGKLAKTVTKTDSELEADIAAADSASNARLAAASIEQLLTRRPSDGALWLRLADRLAAATPISDSDGYTLPSKMVGAGLRAYFLAKTRPDEAAALVLAARGFVKREQWRPALMAYKESLKLAETPGVRADYEQLRADRGFRITDYKVDTESMPPRVCFELSDPVSRAVTDFSPYFSIEPGPVSAVSAENTRICIEGLKYGERYAVTARKGLPAAIDDEFVKDFEYEFYVRDRSASVRFTGKSFVLPRTGQNGIPLISVNSEAAKLALYRIGDRNMINTVLGSDFRALINGYGAQDIADRSGTAVWQGEMATPGPRNEDVVTAFPVDEALSKLEPGLYVMTAKAASQKNEDYESVATQWFVVSDLGLSTMLGKDGLHLSLRSIETADAAAGINVRLIARNNEVLAEATTDDQGKAFFAKGLTQGTGGAAPALIVARSDAGDYSFVDLTASAFDLSDRGVDGREAPGAIDAFVYAERGVYRRGETVHTTVLLRDENAMALAGTPVTVIVERPDGVEYWRGTLEDQGAGSAAFDLDINAAAQGGTWRIWAKTDPNGDPVGGTSFLVEDYIPDRIEFDLTAKSAAATAGEGANLAVDGRYLFGAPGAGLDLEGNYTISANEEPFTEWKDYWFGLRDERVDSIYTTLADLPQTDINGHADIAIQLPELPTFTKQVKMDIAIRMREAGGRAVERTASLPITAVRPMIGIKPEFEGGAVSEGQAAGFQVIAIDAEGKRIALKDVAWTLKRLDTSYQWFNSDGYWRYEAVTRSTKLETGVIDIAGEGTTPFSRSLSWGEYRLEFGADGASPASYDFSSGYYGGETASSDTPDTLKLALDTSDVKPGDTINVKIEARYPGKATLQIVGERLLHELNVDVPEGGTTVPLVIGSDWGTGAYVLGTLFKPMDVKAKRMPARAIGVAWFGIDRDQRTLSVKLNAPEIMKPRQTLTVPVKIEGAAPGDEVFMTVAAVDVGILNLTRYDPPAPDNHYFDQKRLSAELRDIYGVLIDGMQGERGKLRSGGDGAAPFTAPPPTQQPLSLFSGIVKVAADGNATVSFDIPAFNGTVRVMAAAWSKDKVGHAASDVIVRDPLVIAGTLPRFVAVGDQSRIRFDFINAEAPAGDYTFGLSIDGPAKVDEVQKIQKLSIGGAGNRVSVSIPLTATGIGTAQIVATLKGPGDVLLDQSYALGVVPNNPLVTKRTTMELAANGGGLNLSNDLTAGMLAGTATVALSVSPLPEVDAAGLVRDLDLYPYGCSEQTVSRALPLLYLSDLGVDPKVLDKGLEERMTDAVARLVNRQAGNGSFGLWSAYGDDSSLWLSAFVTDFMLRAREKGFEIPEDTLISALDYLRNTVGNSPDVEEGQGQDMAYALYVLARAGRAPVGDLKYLADTKLGNFGSALAQAQMAAALAILGDTERADAAFEAATETLTEAAAQNDRSYRYDYGSTLRDASALLTLATESRSDPRVIKAAMDVVAGERARMSYASTQDMAWMVLAARAVNEEAKAIKLKAGSQDSNGALYKVFRGNELDAGYRVTNPGATPLRAVVAVTGVPLVAEPAAANGLVVDRKYYTPYGEPVDIATVAQNTRLVAVLTVTTVDGSQQNGNFLLVDRLPAGFEIENPTLVASGGVSTFNWLTDTTYANYTEFRDDRFVASFTTSSAKLAYMVRAVAPGTYVHPGATVEDMYRPEWNARMASGTLAVTE